MSTANIRQLESLSSLLKVTKTLKTEFHLDSKTGEKTVYCSDCSRRNLIIPLTQNARVQYDRDLY